ncbi:hypothetical protein FB45DRAFT_1139016 [Roridomyces roridus]|uniref:Uncharacterized protein n=1 Tax=Roridomyces roridus TaxID=1738132 RepID=A0AAD7C282_9AGAR|nr:hypothetical protein FB45DRAFT_1139016 [Roridomyces roridus]
MSSISNTQFVHIPVPFLPVQARPKRTRHEFERDNKPSVDADTQRPLKRLRLPTPIMSIHILQLDVIIRPDPAKETPVERSRRLHWDQIYEKHNSPSMHADPPAVQVPVVDMPVVDDDEQMAEVDNDEEMAEPDDDEEMGELDDDVDMAELDDDIVMGEPKGVRKVTYGVSSEPYMKAFRALLNIYSASSRNLLGCLRAVGHTICLTRRQLFLSLIIFPCVLRAKMALLCKLATDVSRTATAPNYPGFRYLMEDALLRFLLGTLSLAQCASRWTNVLENSSFTDSLPPRYPSIHRAKPFPSYDDAKPPSAPRPLPGACPHYPTCYGHPSATLGQPAIVFPRSAPSTRCNSRGFLFNGQSLYFCLLAFWLYLFDSLSVFSDLRLLLDVFV